MSRLYLFIAGIMFMFVGIALLGSLTTYTAGMGAIERVLIPALPFLVGICAVAISFIGFRKGEGE